MLNNHIYHDSNYIVLNELSLSVCVEKFNILNSVV